jgi:hypothetical protein
MSNESNQNMFDQDVKTLMFYFNQNLFKIKSELDLAVKSFSQSKEITKMDNKKTFKELEKLKNEVFDFQEKIASQSAKSEIVDTELSKFKSGNKQSILVNQGFQNNEINDDLCDIKLSLKIHEHKIRSNDKQEIHKNFNIVKEEVVESLNLMSNEINSYINKNTNLLEINKNLRAKYKALDEINYKKRFCIHCQIHFIPKFNDDKSCLYHPGKLQYYSCRGCGDDEYYTCCNRCMKCSKGCKYSKHVSEI